MCSSTTRPFRLLRHIGIRANIQVEGLTKAQLQDISQHLSKGIFIQRSASVGKLIPLKMHSVQQVLWKEGKLCTYHLEALHAVLDIPLDQGLQLGGLQGGGAWGLALQPLVPGHHIIPEKHTENVGNATVVSYAGLQVPIYLCQAKCRKQVGPLSHCHNEMIIV